MVKRNQPARHKPPRIPESREVLWKALRVMRVATARQLAAVCERPKNSVQVDLRYLMRTGYLRIDGSVDQRNRNNPYTLIRDTGPKPPMFVIVDKELRGAVDRNTRDIFGVDGGPPPVDAFQHHQRGCWMPKASPARGRPLRAPKKSPAGHTLRTVVTPHMKWKWRQPK